MDKQTLSNYGWLIIVTLILAVMLALATPFGTYVGDAVVSVANGFVGTSDNAIDKNNISSMQNKWEEKLNANVGAVTFCETIVPKGDGLYDYISTPITFTWNELLNMDEELVYEYNLRSYPLDISKSHIGDGIFYYNALITSITIPSGVTSIGRDAFAFNWQLENVTIPSSVKSIGSCAFDTCPKLTNITLPEGVESIGSYAFCCCEGLSSVTIPSSVTRIEESVFDSCISLTNVTYNGTIAQWDAIKKGSDLYESQTWNLSSVIKTVTCTDGIITL